MERLKIYTFVHRYINVRACVRACVHACVCAPVMNISVAAFKQFGCVSKYCAYIIREESNEEVTFKISDNRVTLTLNHLNKFHS